MTDRSNHIGEIIQGTVVAIAVDPDGPLCGMFLRGKSGVGKSDLALTMIDGCPWQRSRLVCDDVAIIQAKGDDLYARCPENIQDMIEVRGIGILPMQTMERVKLQMICDLDDSPERMPEDKQEKIIGASERTLPVYPLAALEISTPVKIRQAMRAFLARHFDGSRQDGDKAKRGTR